MAKMVSPSLARRTAIFGAVSLSRSKAWSGCPSSKQMKFVTSTILLMLRAPHASTARRSQAGLGPTLTPSISMPMYRGQSSPDSISTNWARGIEPRSAFSILRRGAWRAAESSRATPKWLRQSPRSGVRPISKISVWNGATVAGVCRSRIEPSDTPKGVSSGRRKSDALSLPSPNSTSLQSMPFETSPRNFETFIFKSPICAPTGANGTIQPSQIPGAPQTTRINSPFPASTSTKCK